MINFFALYEAHQQNQNPRQHLIFLIFNQKQSEYKFIHMIRRLTKVPLPILRLIIRQGLDQQYNQVLRRQGYVLTLLRLNRYGTERDDDATTQIREINREVGQKWRDLIANTNRPSLLRFFRRQRDRFHSKKIISFLRLFRVENQEESRWQTIERLRRRYALRHNLLIDQPENEERKE